MLNFSGSLPVFWGINYMKTKMKTEDQTGDQTVSRKDGIPVPASADSADRRDPPRDVGRIFLPGEDAPRKKTLCPSAPAAEKAVLLGAIRSDGSVAFIKDRIEVTPEFLDIAATGGAPETRFRFSSPCLGGACKQWSDGGCSLPGRLAAMIQESDTADAALPECSIRDQCRWFEQRGPEACRLCPLVVTRDNPQ